METFMQIFSPMIGFTYHCFDRVVISGYISVRSRPECVVYFFRNVLKKPCITKEVLGLRTKDYNKWVASYAQNQGIPLEWAEKDVRKEDHEHRSCPKADSQRGFDPMGHAGPLYSVSG